jgi:hypothetical protein
VHLIQLCRRKSDHRRRHIGIRGYVCSGELDMQLMDPREVHYSCDLNLIVRIQDCQGLGCLTSRRELVIPYGMTGRTIWSVQLLPYHTFPFPRSHLYQTCTRAELSQANSVYDISKERGFTHSYEREYYDLIRAGLLKFRCVLYHIRRYDC